MRTNLSLSDDQWRVGSVPPKKRADVYDVVEVMEWLPAMVPGDVRLDLLRAGRIPEPYYAMNNEASKWIDELDWWFVRDLAIPETDDRLFLGFDGIDYESAVYWNGVLLGAHVGMFSRQVYEIPPDRRTSPSELAVRIRGAHALPRCDLNTWERLLRFVAAQVYPGIPLFPDRLASMKWQMSYGWDFAPALATCGIWDDVALVSARDLFIRDVWVRGVPDGRVKFRIEIDAATERKVNAQVVVHGKNFDSDEAHFEFHLRAQRGVREYEFDFQLQAPQVWNPWDRGAPNLYTLELKLVEEAGELDSVQTTFGLRTIELLPNPGAPADEPPWTFKVNGVAEFIRGANWVPADAIPARLLRSDYGELIRLAREANINLLRVWGGGLREKRAFYELCDENGILVWQDFPFSVAQLDHFPRDAGYATFIRHEVAAIVRALRNHPSLALWCGGNEFDPRTNAHVIDIVRRTVAELDGTRPFKPASPSIGEHHNWRVWHHQANTRDYREEDAAFFGEFGMQAPPSVEALRRFIPSELLWLPGKMWEYHKAELEKLWRYARSINPRASSLQEFVDASQQAQLRGLQVMIEHARRNKPRVSGCLFWQLNEPWHAICWSVITYCRELKPAYYKIRELYNPLFISFDYPLVPRGGGEIVRGELWLINDRLDEISGELRAYHNGNQVHSKQVWVSGNEVRRLGEFEIQLRDEQNFLALELWHDGGIVSTNEYDLNYCDSGEISWFSARYADIGARLME